MARWTDRIGCEGTPEDVLDVLTEAAAIERWSPVSFELMGLDHGRLRPGDRVRVRGSLAGRGVEFAVAVADAGEGRLALTASGPIDIGVEYVARPARHGTDLWARIDVAGQGLRGRLLAGAAEALLAGGALRAAMTRIAREVEPALAA